MFNFSDNNDFDTILQRCLARIDDRLDKRQGSIIYDALAPACAELAQCYIALDVYADQTYLENSTGENLDNLVKNYGLTRVEATYSQRIGNFTNVNNEAMTIEIGSRFSVPNEYGGYNYTVISEIQTGEYVLQCETKGVVGNEYFGVLLPLTSINNLGTATLGSVYVAGEDKETDESLRQRAIDKISETPFGGNIADYKQYIEALDGVGECLVIPAWNGGGTVKLVIITSSYDIPTPTLINNIQTLIDPLTNSGEGLGKAPIGHQVTVVAPTAYELTIKGDISLEDNYTLEGIQENIETAILEYITSIQKQWANNTTITIYISRLIAAIIGVEGVTNIENLVINENSDNITIDVTSLGNPYPIFKEVILNES